MIRNSLRVGAFLAHRYIQHTNKWMSALVVFVMMLTFLNLVVISGLLVGIVVGSEDAFRSQYAGDVLISTLPTKSYIEQSDAIITTLKDLPSVSTFAPRYAVGGEIEANYKNTIRSPNTLSDTAGGEVVGIDVTREKRVTHLDDFLIEGSFLSQTDQDMVLLGGNLVERYFAAGTGRETVSNVHIGDTVLLHIGDISREVTVKGIIKAKAGQVDQRIYLPDTQLRKLINRFDFNIDEIAVKTMPGFSATVVRDEILSRSAGKHALVRTASESIGDFLDDIKTTFGILGNVVGAIGLAVASITIFIVIFIMAITRQKSIGILKGIGISELAIEVSYVLLSFFYSVIGVALGLVVVYAGLVPYFQQNPINFPFSDGILAVTTSGTAVRVLLIILTTIIAGYVPAKLVVRKKALDAILGR